MEAGNNPTQTHVQAETKHLHKITVQGRMFYFLSWLSHIVSEYRPYYDVIETGNGYTLIHRRGKWIARFDSNGIEVAAYNDVVKATDELLFGGYRVDAACIFGGRCFTADELRLLAFTYIAVWYMSAGNLQPLGRLACALRFGVQEDGSTRDGRVYVYSLRRFFTEIERITRVANLYYEVNSSEDGYVVVNHCRTWNAKLYYNGDIEVTDDKHILKITGDEMQLDGTPVENVCVYSTCFDAHAVRITMLTYVVLWHYQNDKRDAIRRLAQMVRPCR